MDQHDKNPQKDPNLERKPDDREDSDITNREEDLQREGNLGNERNRNQPDTERRPGGNRDVSFQNSTPLTACLPEARVFMRAKDGGEGRTRTFEALGRQIYSLLRLTASLPRLIVSLGNRVFDLRV